MDVLADLRHLDIATDTAVTTIRDRGPSAYHWWTMTAARILPDNPWTLSDDTWGELHTRLAEDIMTTRVRIHDRITSTATSTRTAVVTTRPDVSWINPQQIQERADVFTANPVLALNAPQRRRDPYPRWQTDPTTAVTRLLTATYVRSTYVMRPDNATWFTAFADAAALTVNRAIDAALPTPQPHTHPIDAYATYPPCLADRRHR